MSAAEADDFVFYGYEWEYDGVQLSPFGQRHLDQVAQRLPFEPFEVVVARSQNEELDAARRKVIVERLSAQGISDADARVAVNWPKALPLLGRGAYRIDAGYFRSGGQSGNQGAGLGGNASIGSFGGGRAGF